LPAGRGGGPGLRGWAGQDRPGGGGQGFRADWSAGLRSGSRQCPQAL